MRRARSRWAAGSSATSCPISTASCSPQLPLLVVGSLDARSRPWASMLVGEPGFVHSPDAAHAARRAHGPRRRSARATNLAAGAPLGLLGIELATRRRNRMNGTVAARRRRTASRSASARASATVRSTSRRAMPVCVRRSADRGGAARCVRKAALSDARAATRAPRRHVLHRQRLRRTRARACAADGVDVSHRGGKPGFRARAHRRERDGRACSPRRTSAAISCSTRSATSRLDPRAGLVLRRLRDAATCCSLTGGAEIVWDGAEVASFAGAERLLRFRVDTPASVIANARAAAMVGQRAGTAFKRALLAVKAVAFPGEGERALFRQRGRAPRHRGGDEGQAQPMAAEDTVEVVARGDADMVVVVSSRIFDVQGVDPVGPIPAELQTRIGFAAGSWGRRQGRGGGERADPFPHGPGGEADAAGQGRRAVVGRLARMTRSRLVPSPRELFASGGEGRRASARRGGGLFRRFSVR